MAVYTFSCIVGQDRTSSHLLSLCVLSRAGVGAVRPGGPGTQGAVLWTRHLTDDRHGQNGVAAQLLFHIFTWEDRSNITHWGIQRTEGGGWCGKSCQVNRKFQVAEGAGDPLASALLTYWNTVF